jgi:steroid delta-isomerase-like uncharacterized protein
MSVVANKAIVLRALRAFNDPDTRESYFELYAPHAVLHRAPPLDPGLENIKRFYRAFWTAFPDIKLSASNLIGEDEYVACSFEVRATHRGPFLDVPATGRVVTFSGVTLLRFEQSQCVERWSQTDLLSLLRQLGAYPPPQ